MRKMRRDVGDYAFYCRPGTNDYGIVERIFGRNGYRLPEDMRGKVVVDVGAHIGSVSILASLRGASVYAYEPCSDNFESLLMNMIENRAYAIEAHKLGVGVPGERKLYLDFVNRGQNTLFLDINDFPHDVCEVVEVVSLNSVFKDNLIPRCTLLKLDCEGAEREILDEVIDGLHQVVDTIALEILEDSEKYLALLEPLYTIEKTGADEYLLVSRRFDL